MLKRAATEIAQIEGELKKLGPNKPAMARELKRKIREHETAAGASVSEMRRWLKTAQRGEMEAEAAKRALVEANLRPCGFRSQEVCQPRVAPAGLDPGG